MRLRSSERPAARVAAMALLAALVPPQAIAHPTIDVLRQGLRAEGARRHGDPDLDLAQARAARIAGDFDAALDALVRARDHGADGATVSIVRGEVFDAAGRQRAALGEFDRAVTLAPERADARFLRGRALVALGRPAEGGADFEWALARLRRPQPDHYLELRDARLAAGDQAGALAALSAGIGRLGPLSSLQLPAVDLAIDMGRHEDALTRIDTLLARNPANEAWLARRGDVLARMGRHGEAHQAWTSALAHLARRRPRRHGRRIDELERDIRAALESTAKPTEDPE